MQKFLKSGIRLLIIVILISLIPLSVSAEGQVPEKIIDVAVFDGIETKTLYQGDTIYSDEASSTFDRWNSTLTTYLIDNQDRTKSVIAANKEKKIVTLADYDLDNQLISEKAIDFELPIFGAFYQGKQYNYIAFGQENREENDAKEVIRIVRYDQNFNRIDSVSITGGDSFTIAPFEASCGRMSENGNELVLHTSRLRYTTTDGLNHQSQLTIILNTQTMTVTNYLGRFQANHVSHSFDQYVRFDGVNHVLIDHGDAYPRSIVLNKESGTTYEDVSLFDIPGTIGANCTGVSVGGFEISANHYVVAMNTIDHSKVTQYTSYEMIGLDRDQRDILLCLLPKNSLNSADVKQITLAKYVDTDKIGSVPKLVKITDDQLMVLWQEFSIINKSDTETGALKYVLIDGDGNRTGDIQSISGFKLGESDPQLIDSEVVWCTHEEGLRKLYAIPLSGSPKISISTFITDKVSGQTTGTPIGLTASAIGGTGSYQYKFYYKNELETSVIQDFSSSDSTNFVPEAVGNYTLFVDVKDSSGKTATKSIVDFQITEMPKPVVKNFDTDKASGQFPKTSIKLRAEGSDGKSPYEFKFYYQYGGVTTIIQNFSTANTADFKPTQAGNYELTVEIKDARGSIATKTIENYQILKPEQDISTHYSTHIQNIGWQNWMQNGAVSGTFGKSLRLEGVQIYLTSKSNYDLSVSYSTHIQNIGWQTPQNAGYISGTTGKGFRLEAIKINLTGSDADLFDIYYQVHAENLGWLDWAKNSEESGTAGFGYRLEALRVLVVPKGDPAPGETTRPFVQN